MSIAPMVARRVIVGRGVIVLVDGSDFVRVAEEARARGGLVIHGVTRVVSKIHVYITSYNGIVFIAKSKDPLPVRVDVEAEKLDVLVAI